MEYSFSTFHGNLNGTLPTQGSTNPFSVLLQNSNDNVQREEPFDLSNLLSQLAMEDLTKIYQCSMPFVCPATVVALACSTPATTPLPPSSSLTSTASYGLVSGDTLASRPKAGLRHYLVLTSLISCVVHRSFLEKLMQKHPQLRQSVQVFFFNDKLNFSQLNLFGNILLHTFQFKNPNNGTTSRNNKLVENIRAKIGGRSIWTSSDLSFCNAKKRKILEERIQKFPVETIENEKEKLVAHFGSILGPTF